MSYYKLLKKHLIMWSKLIMQLFSCKNKTYFEGLRGRDGLEY